MARERMTRVLRRAGGTGVIVSMLVANVVLAPMAGPQAQAGATAAPATGPAVGFGYDAHDITSGNDMLGFPAQSTCTSSNSPCATLAGVVRSDTGLGALQSVSAGVYFTAGVDASGSVWSWGINDYKGVLGQAGASVNLAYPPGHVVGVGGTGTLGGVTAVASGYRHTLALLGNGEVVAWGDDEMGQLGDGTDQPNVSCRCSAVPLPVVGPNGTGLLGDGAATPPIIAISAGYLNGFALDSSGQVWAWGNDSASQLGDGLPHTSPGCLVAASSNPQIFDPCSVTPVMVTGFGGASPHATAIAGGADDGYAIVAGNVWAWGDASSGALGNGSNSSGGATPSEVLVGAGPLSGITAIAGGRQYGLAVKGTGSTSTVWGWGYNLFGGLGNGTTADSLKATQVHGKGNVGFLTGIKNVSASILSANSSEGSSYAVTTGGGVWGWGQDDYGQLGDNSTGDAHALRLTPVKAKGVYSTSPTSAQSTLGGIQQVAASGSFAIAYGAADDVTLSGGCPSTATLGTTYVCTFTVVNNGPVTMSPSVSGIVPITSPANAVAFTSATTTGKAGTTRLTCTAPAQGSTTGAILCPVGSMAPGPTAQTVTVTFKAKLATTSTFTPSVGGAFLDLTSADNAVITTTTQS